MKLTVKTEAGVCIVSLDGRLDLATGANLKEEIKKICDSGAKIIHINLKKVEFINSSGLGAFVSIMKQVRSKKGRLTLSNLAAPVREIFEITQLSSVFDIFETQEEAMSATERIAIE